MVMKNRHESWEECYGEMSFEEGTAYVAKEREFLESRVKPYLDWQNEMSSKYGNLFHFSRTVQGVEIVLNRKTFEHHSFAKWRRYVAELDSKSVAALAKEMKAQIPYTLPSGKPRPIKRR
jgi:hypothetical protein